MTMNTNSFGLLNALATILNSKRGDSDYAIASYLVSHLDELESVSITDIMVNAFVTRSAVRRFCNRTGFSSFSDFKAHVTSAAYPSDLNHRDLSIPLERYRADLDSGIAQVFASMADAVDNHMVEACAQTIDACEHVVLMAAGNTSGILERFQQELFFAQTYVQLVTESYQEQLAEAAREGCLVMVVSASGVFARQAESLIADLPATRALVTANDEFIGNPVFDQVYCLANHHIDFDTLGLFGKYGVTYFFDLLSASLLARHAR